MKRSLHSITIEREETDGKLSEWCIWFRMYPSSGDGWHDPIDPGGLEFAGVSHHKSRRGTPVPPGVWEWAELEFDRRENECTEIACADHADWRDDAAEYRRIST